MKYYSPKRIVRTFRDLDIYQQTLAASVTVTRDLKSKLKRLGYPLTDNLINCTLSIPFFISEAHSIRFGDYARSIRLLEQAMADCNKMVVYLEQSRGLYGDKLDFDSIETLVNKYATVRTKIFHLEKSWQKFSQNTAAVNKTAPLNVNQVRI